MANKKEIESLIQKRGTTKGQLTRFSTFINKQDKGGDLTELEDRLIDLKSILEKFDGIQTQLEIINTEKSPEEHAKEREEFEDAYYAARSRALTILKADVKTDSITRPAIPLFQGTQNASDNPNPSVVPITRDVVLPPINLTTFDGSIHDWLFFKDTFTSLIHNNKNLSDIQRFHYLRLSLKGSAAEILSSLSISSDNYKIAWDLLHERFENKTLLINNHVKSIFNLPTIMKESFSCLRALLDNVTKHLRALEVLQLPVKEWDVLLIHLVSSKLDQKTRREWEERCAGPDVPKFNDFDTFLKNKCRLLENLQPEISEVKGRNERIFSKPKYSHFATETKTPETTTPTCIICQQNHMIHSCPKFTNLGTEKRWAEVKRLRLCQNCLRDNHTVKFCRSGNCRKCNRRHHTLLHKSE